MTLADLVSVGSIVSSVAVAASLIYLGLQIHTQAVAVLARIPHLAASVRGYGRTSQALRKRL